MVNIADVGNAINPKIVRAAAPAGASIMQLGFTMFEKMQFEEGRLLNASLADYKIPGLLDVPAEMVTEFVEADQQAGPFGAKGAGETGTFCVSPAIANAIHDAVGVRLTELPLTPEAVYRALHGLDDDA